MQHNNSANNEFGVYEDIDVEQLGVYETVDNEILGSCEVAGNGELALTVNSLSNSQHNATNHHDVHEPATHYDQLVTVHHDLLTNNQCATCWRYALFLRI